MSDTPLFSFLVAAFQAELTIAETLGSLLSQTDPRWEAIVVDDGSTDRTYAVAASFAERDARVRVLQQPNTGAAAARNAAAGAATGRWYVALDADDLLVPDALERQAVFIDDHPGFELYSWGAWIQLADGSRIPFDTSPEYRQIASFDLRDLIDRNRILSNTCVDAEAFRRAGGFRDLYTEDYDLWLRMLLQGSRHIHNPELLVVYRQQESSKSADTWRNMSGTAEVLEALADAEGVDADVAEAARARAAFWRSWAARTQLEKSIDARDWVSARAVLSAARPTFPGDLKSRIGLALLSVAPSLYARYKTWRATRS